MTKVIWVCRYRQGMDRADASRHWKNTHGGLGAKVPGLDRYVQNHAVEPIGEGPLRFDGYSCGWYADITAYEASTRTPEWGAIGADSSNVFEHDFFATMSAVVDEVVVKAGGGGFKIAMVLRFRENMTKDEARTYWREQHGALAARVGGLDGYVQNHATTPLGMTGVDPSIRLGFDGVAELWFRDRAAFEQATKSPEWDATARDAGKFLDLTNAWGAVVEEHPIKS